MSIFFLYVKASLIWITINCRYEFCKKLLFFSLSDQFIVSSNVSLIYSCFLNFHNKFYYHVLFFISAVNMVNGITVNGLGEVALDQGSSLITLGEFLKIVFYLFAEHAKLLKPLHLVYIGKLWLLIMCIL